MLYIVPSIDVEAAHGNNPFEQMILGKIDKKEPFGVFKIANVLSKYLASGTFFIDIYEYKLWGENKFKKLVTELLSLDQDVQLHTHPSWRWDKRDSYKLNLYKTKNSYLDTNSDFMAKLSLEKQKEVINHGMEKLYKWTGLETIIHRSGGYSVNLDTLKALNSLGVKMDSSFNFCHPNSKLKYKYYNKPSIISKVHEFPVTISEATLGRWLPFNLVKRKKVKTDVNILDSKQMISWTKQALNNDVRYMSLFMHSYSLLFWDRYYSSFSRNIAAFEELIKFLDWCSSQEQIKLVSYKWLYNNQQSLNYCLNGSDYIPSTLITFKQAINYSFLKIKDYYYYL